MLKDWNRLEQPSKEEMEQRLKTVSYTHLTLPTTSRV